MDTFSSCQTKVDSGNGAQRVSSSRDVTTACNSEDA